MKLHHKTAVTRAYQHGFSLIELLIAVVIIGILSSIALPSYSNYVIRSKIPDATSALANKRVQMEQYFQDNRRYTATSGGVTCGIPNTDPDTTTSSHFTFTCVATNTTFTLSATGKSAMEGFSYTINASNARTSDIVLPAKAGWIAANTCWITNTGGKC